MFTSAQENLSTLASRLSRHLFTSKHVHAAPTNVHSTFQRRCVMIHGIQGPVPGLKCFSDLSQHPRTFAHLLNCRCRGRSLHRIKIVFIPILKALPGRGDLFLLKPPAMHGTVDLHLERPLAAQPHELFQLHPLDCLGGLARGRIFWNLW